MPFEIICNDGTTTNALTQEVLVAPDPANFQYQVFTNGCNAPPTVGSPADPQQPCTVYSNSSTVITAPVDGCPPIAGELEVGLEYLDDNANPIDLTAFSCDGFPESVILLQPGCTNCPCANAPTNISGTTDICEGDMVELCFEFAPDDAANAVGTEITLTGALGTLANFILTGDGTSSTYCIQFFPESFVGCTPGTEIIDLDLYCGANGSNIFYGIIALTVYPSLDKFNYDVIPAVDNCPNAPVYPQIISTGECDLDIFDVVTVDPVDGCPPTPGSLTYSVSANEDFSDPPPECMFTEVVNAVEPIPACDTCEPQTCSISTEISEIVCDDNETPQL